MRLQRGMVVNSRPHTNSDAVRPSSMPVRNCCASLRLIRAKPTQSLRTKSALTPIKNVSIAHETTPQNGVVSVTEITSGSAPSKLEVPNIKRHNDDVCVTVASM